MNVSGVPTYDHSAPSHLPSLLSFSSYLLASLASLSLLRIIERFNPLFTF